MRCPGHHYLYLAIKALATVIGHQPPRDHLSSPGSACNFPVVGTLQTKYQYVQDLIESHDVRPRLLLREGSSVTTCLVAPDPASRHGRTLASPRVPQRQTPPPSTGGLRRRHVPRGARPHLSAWEGSIITTCPMAPYPPPDEKGLWCCHVPHGSKPTSRHGRASTLPCATRHHTSPPSTRGL
jgi:hypothetical protein